MLGRLVGWSCVGWVGSIPAWVQCTPRGHHPYSAPLYFVRSSFNPFGHIVDFAFFFKSTSFFLFLFLHSFLYLSVLFPSVSFYIFRHSLFLVLFAAFLFLFPSILYIYILLFVFNGRSSFFGFSCAQRVEPRQSTNPVRREGIAGTTNCCEGR